MRNLSRIGTSPIKDRFDAIDWTGTAALFRFHEASGTTVVDACGVVGNQTISGVTTSCRSHSGGITFNANATASNNNRIRISDAGLDAIMNPATVTAHQILLVNVCMDICATITGYEYLWSVGVPDGPVGTPGGFGFRMGTNRWPQFAWRQVGSATITTHQGSAIGTPAFYPVRRSYLCAMDFRDPANPLVTMYINGAPSGVSNAALANNTAAGALPSLNTNAGIWIGGRPNSAVPHNGDPQECAGTKTTGTTVLRNVLFARISDTYASLIPTLALEMASRPDDLPETLLRMVP